MSRSTQRSALGIQPVNIVGSWKESLTAETRRNGNTNEPQIFGEQCKIETADAHRPENQNGVDYLPSKAEPSGGFGSSMDFNEFLLIFVVALLIAIPLIAGPSDRKRIREEIEGNGGTVLEISYKPFAKFWINRGWARMYEVTYRTRDGQNVTAICRATRFSGLSWITDLPPRF